MEHRRVRRIVVATENTARHYSLERRLCGLHHMDLTGRSMCAEKNIVGNIEGVLLVACRVVKRLIEGCEVVVIVLDLGALVNYEAHTGKYSAKLVLNESYGMERTDTAYLCGH